MGVPWALAAEATEVHPRKRRVGIGERSNTGWRGKTPLMGDAEQARGIRDKVKVV